MKKLLLLMLAVCVLGVSACAPQGGDSDPNAPKPEFKPERVEGQSNAPAAPGG